MANYKTIILDGSEQKLSVSGANCDIRNDSSDTVYASAAAGVTADADGVLSVPVGASAKLLDVKGIVYLLGTGKVHICGSDYAQAVFKCAAVGGSGSGEVSKSYVDNGDDTSLALAKGFALDTFSNPNLLRNPDFAINQRGVTSLATGAAYEYFADGWYTARSVVEVTDNGITLAWNGTDGTHAYIQQNIENNSLFGEAITVSALIDGEWLSAQVTVPETAGTTNYADMGSCSVSAANWSGRFMSVSVFVSVTEPVTISCVKAEKGGTATAYTAPEPAAELARCQRYYRIRSTDTIAAADLCPSMLREPEKTLLDDGTYAYAAEIR